MPPRVYRVAALLFGSGMCALIYQVVWLRELRLVFGASTAASAAVLAIFMGGLGIGSAVLGKRVDRLSRPLAFYANLEFGIAASAFLTPFLILLVRWGYIELGGSAALGLAGATVVRLLASALVLSLPTMLMGGTLPAVAKAVETADDPNRRYLAVLYGVNTLGAVTGALAATFFMLSNFGTRNTLWLACLANLLVAMAARQVARSAAAGTPATGDDSPPAAPAAEAPAASPLPGPSARTPASRFIYAAAAVVGFAFFLMELVWYRMLGPLLGGSTYTFGLILAVALLGIGLGGAAYAVFTRKRPATLATFALTCGLEALCIAVPYALGDKLAILAVLLLPLGLTGFAARVLVWAVLAGIVIFPAAVIAGYQFPLLIALLGRSGENVGRQTGFAYAWNTVGAIGGSLAGGFGLLSLLTAPGTWRAVVLLLAALGLAAALLAWWNRATPKLRLAGPALVAVAATLLLWAKGPTAAWRHNPIGAGRATIPEVSANGLRSWLHDSRRYVLKDMEGIESSVGLINSNELAFFVNGKSDGSARSDSSTQVMLGLVSAILHPQPRRSLVIGLGTGSSAGWLADVESMERVDVVELEPVIKEVARLCGPVNRNVLDNPKVVIHYADAREALLTAKKKYDLIVSEPSNPYRAGIASLYTFEFYQAVANCLAEGGMFSQWVQSYEVDAQTIRTIYTTLSAVFPVVETWQTNPADMLLICALKPIVYDVAALRLRLRQEPFRSALFYVWRTDDLEGFLSRFVAHSSFAQKIASQDRRRMNTDDRTLIEFAFARTVGRQDLFSIEELREEARQRGRQRPDVSGGNVDWDSVEEQRTHMFTLRKSTQPIHDHVSKDRRQRIRARIHFTRGNMPGVLGVWRRQGRRPVHLLDVTMIAEALADAGNEKPALKAIDKLRQFQPLEADVILARLRWRQEKYPEATTLLVSAFERYREDPWPLVMVMKRSLDIAIGLAGEGKVYARQLAPALSQPFSVYLLNDARKVAALQVANKISPAATAEVIAREFEPCVPWRLKFLLKRFECYRASKHALAGRAEKELLEFLSAQPARFAGLVEKESPPPPPPVAPEKP